MAVYSMEKFKSQKFSKIRKAKKILRILFMVYVVVYLSINYREYSPREIARVASYISAQSFGEIDFNEIELLNTKTSRVEEFKGFIIDIDRDMLTYINTAGEVEAEIKYSFDNPDIACGKNKMIVFDRNGFEYILLDSYGEIERFQTKSAILDINFNEKDEYVVVTDEEGFISAVSVFNTKAEEHLFKWSTSLYNVVTAESSDRGDKLAVLCIFSKDVSFKSNIIIFDLNDIKTIVLDEESAVINDEDATKVEFSDRFPVELEFLQNGNIAVIFTDGISVLSAQGEIIKEISALDLNGFDISNKSKIAYTETVSGQRTILKLLDSNGDLINSKEFEEEIRDFKVSESYVYVLTNKRTLKLDLELNEVRSATHDKGIYSLILHQSGAVYGVNTNKVERIF